MSRHDPKVTQTAMRKEGSRMPDWEATTRRLEAERKQRLPETDTGLAIQRFARSWKFLHQNRRPAATTGLVEQQALFRKLARIPKRTIADEGPD